MKTNPLEGARAKIDRAKHHLHQLKSEIAARDLEAHGFSFRHEPQTGELVVALYPPRDLLIHYAILAGEVVHQARSALEHCVWELVPAATSGKQTAFPVYPAETKADVPRVAAALGRKGAGYYNGDGLRAINGINPAAAAIIKGLQPFGPDFQTHPLYILNELWNRDKHRLLTTCVAGVIATHVYFARPGGTLETRRIDIPPYVKEDTELFRERHPGADVEVSAEVATIGIVFDDGVVKGKPVPELLHKLVEFAERVVNDLARTV